MTDIGRLQQLGIRVVALAIAGLALAARTRLGVVALVVVAVLVWQVGRLPELAEGRRLWGNAWDPEFQGDGWRWTLSLLLPGILVGRVRQGRPHVPVGAPVTLDMAVLTVEQRQSCYAEWLETQRLYAQWEAEAMWRDRFGTDNEEGTR